MTEATDVPPRGLMVPFTLRVVTAGLLAGISVIHLDLWASHGYQRIPTIGPLFLLTGAAGAILTVACLAAPRTRAGVVAAVSVVFAAGALGALIISVTVGLFGFIDSSTAPLFNQAIAVESAAVVAATLLWATSRQRRGTRRARHHTP